MTLLPLSGLYLSSPPDIQTNIHLVVGGAMKFSAFFLCMALLLGIPWFAFGAELPKVGSLAPDFTLLSQEGEPIQLSKQRGKWVVLYFYPKDMTPGCSLEARNFAKDQPEYTRRNAIVLGVSVDSVESHKAFCTKENLTFKLLADTEKKVSESYGSLKNLVVTKMSARHTFLIDPQGKIAKVYDDVKPAVHSREVLTALDALGAGKPVQGR
jgi:peroxiredoxin Q/BCP